MMLLFWLACTEDVAQEVPEEVVAQHEPMRLLRRWSLDIRGVLPSMEELEMVRADATQLEPLLDVFLDDERWEDQLMHRLQEQWHTRVDKFSVVPDDFYLGGYNSWYSFNRSVGEEPLRLMAHIATEDLPWTDILLADYSMANEQLASMYPIEYPENASGWQKAYYTDGRPAVGVLATNGLWWRYITDSLNMNRMRAATTMRLLLCDDLLSRPISFEASAHALEDTTTALQQDWACLNCHASLDPLASALFGFYWIEEGNPLEAVAYHPERELLGPHYIGVDPAFYGTPVGTLADLGLAIIRDPRFGQCAVQNFSEMYLRRKMGALDHHSLQPHVDKFVEGELRIKPLVKSILLSSEYIRKDSPEDKRVHTLRLLTPRQLMSSMEAWNPQGWEIDNAPLLDDAYRVMMGGVDGLNTFAPQLYPSTTSGLTLKRFSQFTATQIVEESLALDTGLLAFVDESTTSQEESFSKQIDLLRIQLHATEPTEEWRTDITALWESCAAEDSTKLGWICVISAMMQDLDFVSY